MAKEKSFEWLGADFSDWSGGRLILMHGQKYEASLVDAAVLAEWVRTGAARMVKAEEK